MHTVHQPPGTGERPDGPRVTPYFALAVEQAETFYAGGLPPEAA